MNMKTLLLIATLLAVTYAEVTSRMKKTSVWRTKVNGVKVKKVHAYCKFVIPETQFAGDWEVNITLTRPTTEIKLWIMDVESSGSGGMWYFTKNKYDYQPQTIDVQFELTMGKKDKIPRGLCISNLTKPPKKTTTSTTTTTTSTTTTTTTTPAPTQETVATTTPSTSGAVTPIVIVQDWDDNGATKFKGICVYNLKEKLDDFHVNISMSEETFALEVWVGSVEKSDPQGKWYYLDNYWTVHPPKLVIEFMAKTDSDNVPVGTCNIPELDGITTSAPKTTQAPVTTKEPTTKAPVTTKAPTTQAPVTTNSPTTKAPVTTNAPTTKAPVTTNAPTTKEPVTTNAPTTKEPVTTNAPTTKEPVTTNAPTTNAPVTTKAPTTQAPTTVNPVTTTSPNLNTKYDYAQALNLSILFYEAQRSGKLPANNRIPYRGDSALGDKDGNIDLTGGWYDAGDGVKFNFPMAASTSLLAWGVYTWKESYLYANQLSYVYDSIKWPLDYFLKCWQPAKNEYYAQVGNGDIDHAYWGRHEDMTMQRPAYKVTTSSPGSDVAGETAAAFTAGYLAFKDFDAAYANTLLDAGKSLFEFAYNYKGKYSDAIPDAAKFYNSFSGYKDELCFSAALLYKATNDPVYLQKAKNMESLGTSWALSWDDKTVACQALLYELTKESKYANAVNDFVKSYLPGGITYTPDGLAWRIQWGSNRYAANAAFIALMASEMGIGDSKVNNQFAESQINFILGDNKYPDFSYMIGFGKKYPLKPHHRASSCPTAGTCDWNDYNSNLPNPHTLLGAVVGGPDQSGNYQDVRSDYVMNEVTCDYNAGFQSAVAGLISMARKNQL